MKRLDRPRLDDREEALLDGWPAPTRGALEWEDAASRTMARVRDTGFGSTPDALLEPPLPVEGHEESLPAPRDEEPTLADIARAVIAPKDGETSRSVARDVLLAAEEERRSGPPRTSRRSREEEYWRTAGGELQTSKHNGRAVEAMHEGTRRSVPAGEHPVWRRFGIVALGGGTALALAAGAVFYVSMHSGDEHRALMQPSAEAVRVVTSPPGTTAATAATAATAVASATDPGAHALALDVLPVADEETNAKAEKARVTATPQDLAFHVKSAPAGSAKLILEEREEAPAPEPTPGLPATTAKKEAPASGDLGSDSVGLPPQPSLGAVQAAIGSVMTGARSCLAGQDSGSKATLKFGATGQVTSVSIGGPASGTPAEGCVRSALMGARVPPFSEPSFSASLTIRPP